jgi:hypothetical protein
MVIISTNDDEDVSRRNKMPFEFDHSTIFEIRQLSVLAYANGFTLWHYKTTSLSDVVIPDYFIPPATC